MNVIVIPVFLVLMAAEFGLGLVTGRNVYRLNDAVGSLTAGIRVSMLAPGAALAEDI